LKDIGIIKRVLAEAETSARLVAIRSLELMMNSEAMKVLEESHANAISFEKFFIEKAIDNIKEFQESGSMPLEIRKAIAKQEKLIEDSVKLNSFAVDNGYDLEPVEIGDLSSALSAHKSEISSKTYDNSTDELSSSVGAVESEVHVAEIAEESYPSSEHITDVDGQNLGNSLDLTHNVPSEQSIADENYVNEVEPVESILPSDLIDSQEAVIELENSLNEVDNIEKLLPSATKYESANDYQNSDSYDDLLPSLDSSSENMLDSYDDLLPPLAASSSDEGQIDSFEDLLPPIVSTDSDVAQNFDDLLQSPSNYNSLSIEDDYKDLLPPENSDTLLDLPVEHMPQNVDYDDLLPPLGNLGATQSDDYDDLLPPLDTSASEYDDLLPPMSSDLNTEDLLPPMKIDKEETEGSASDYDDLLPPLNS